MFIATSSFEPCVNAKVGILPGYLCKFGCQDSKNIGSFKWIAPFPLTIYFLFNQSQSGNFLIRTFTRAINHNQDFFALLFWSPGRSRGRSWFPRHFTVCKRGSHVSGNPWFSCFSWSGHNFSLSENQDCFSLFIWCFSSVSNIFCCRCFVSLCWRFL